MLSEFYITVTSQLSPGLDPLEAREIVRILFAWRPLPEDSASIERAELEIDGIRIVNPFLHPA